MSDFDNLSTRAVRADNMSVAAYSTQSQGKSDRSRRSDRNLPEEPSPGPYLRPNRLGTDVDGASTRPARRKHEPDEIDMASTRAVFNTKPKVKDDPKSPVTSTSVKGKESEKEAKENKENKRTSKSVKKTK